MTRIVETRDRVKAAFEREHGTKLTFMPFIFRALAAALRAHPKFNAAIDGETIVYKKDVNLGMAVALDWGLIVPVIHDADQANLAGLAPRPTTSPSARAPRSSSPTRSSAAPSPSPTRASSAACSARRSSTSRRWRSSASARSRSGRWSSPTPTAHDAIAIRTMAYFALTYDHRLVDGADAEHFMRDVKATLETESWSELLGPDPRVKRND